MIIMLKTELRAFTLSVHNNMVGFNYPSHSVYLELLYDLDSCPCPSHST